MIAITMSTIPTTTAGMMSRRSLDILRASAVRDSGDQEVDRGGGAGNPAVDRERRQPVGLEEAHQELDGQVRGHRRAQRADEGRAAHAVALRAREVRELQRG